MVPSGLPAGKRDRLTIVQRFPFSGPRAHRSLDRPSTCDGTVPRWLASTYLVEGDLVNIGFGSRAGSSVG